MEATQAETTETYNGWSNRETWLANLWISNEEGSYNAANELVAETFGEWEPIPALVQFYEDPDMARNGRITAVAEALEEWAGETFAPDLDGFVSDLFDTAWGRIDWREIATDMVEDL